MADSHTIADRERKAVVEVKCTVVLDAGLAWDENHAGEDAPPTFQTPISPHRIAKAGGIINAPLYTVTLPNAGLDICAGPAGTGVTERPVSIVIESRALQTLLFRVARRSAVIEPGEEFQAASKDARAPCGNRAAARVL